MLIPGRQTKFHRGSKITGYYTQKYIIYASVILESVMCSKDDKNLMWVLKINPSTVSLEKFKNMHTFAPICKKILYGFDDEGLTF
jgi:hypothetical protein